jgi:hypothetical protein
MYNFFNIKNRFSNGKRKILFWLLFFLGFVLGAMNSIGEFIACAKKKKNCIVCATLLYGRLENNLVGLYHDDALQRAIKV